MPLIDALEEAGWSVVKRPRRADAASGPAAATPRRSAPRSSTPASEAASRASAPRSSPSRGGTRECPSGSQRRRYRSGCQRRPLPPPRPKRLTAPERAPESRLRLSPAERPLRLPGGYTTARLVSKGALAARPAAAAEVSERTPMRRASFTQTDIPSIGHHVGIPKLPAADRRPRLRDWTGFLAGLQEVLLRLPERRRGRCRERRRGLRPWRGSRSPRRSRRGRRLRRGRRWRG